MKLIMIGSKFSIGSSEIHKEVCTFPIKGDDSFCPRPEVCGLSFGSLFMFSNFDKLDLHNKNFCCVSKSIMKHVQILD